MKTRILFNHEVAVALDQGKTPKNSYQGIRPSIALKPNTEISRGSGLKIDPYVIE